MANTVNVLGISVDKVTTPQALSQVGDFLCGGKCQQIVTINAEFIFLAQKDQDFKQILNAASLRLADGIGILWAAKYLSLKRKGFLPYLLTGASLIFYPKYCRSVIPEKISGSEFIQPLLQLCSAKKTPVFLLGGKKGVAGQVKLNLQKEYPNLQIVGTLAGSPQIEDETMIIDKINASDAKVLLVAYSFPEQEKWIYRNLNRLSSVKVAMGLGGTFDFIAGAKAQSSGFGLRAKKAPAILRKLGLEWLWRLATQPYRFRRVYNAVVKFSWAVKNSP